MPHVIVKLVSGKTEAQKQALSEAIVGDVTSILGYADEAVSVGFEEVVPDEWFSRVYEPEIRGKWSTLLKEPGYGPVSTVSE